MWDQRLFLTYDDNSGTDITSPQELRREDLMSTRDSDLGYDPPISKIY